MLRRMLRRRMGKMTLLVMITLTVVILVLYENLHLAGSPLKNGHRELMQAVQLDALQENVDPRLLYQTTQVTVATTTSAPSSAWDHSVYAHRRQQCENTCVRLREGGVVRTTRHGNTSYCVVPKVGCTFWLNIFRYLYNDTGDRTYSSPYDIPRMVTHYAPLKRMKMYTINNTFTPPNLSTDLRFMFVREPYSRLWSAYVDKFLLVDYWRSEGQRIVKQRKVKANATTPINKCAHDISFREFAEFVVSMQPAQLNEHWKPIQHLCSPCIYRPHVVGKMETFAQDSGFLLEHMNLSWVLASYEHEKHVYDEMDMLIDYNFQLLNHNFYKNCTNATDIADRLWRTFQINGYLPEEIAFPQDKAVKLNATAFKGMVHEAFRHRPKKSPAEWRQQREGAMVAAFKQLSTDTLEKLHNLYASDFELFGYDPRPDSLFKDRMTNTTSS
ncbi:carbohydrate sulfotransferase 11-like isoform X4 [Pomacea canaliculata]|uniref:carbohydrate sulfotransferase 11-like isoform X4 n=1 Tax=Pomacea canaliculata TaxID=400727 RepID=UPI000D727D93|nr:carbohydrate sulfotransferase 11-like isoform X4 [Pomacea canaliculata]